MQSNRLWSILGGLSFMMVQAALGAAAPEQNWPQWRGPLANGVAPNADPPTIWSESANIKWKAKIPGSGTSTPIIWENQIFLQTAVSSAKPEPKPAPEAEAP